MKTLMSSVEQAVTATASSRKPNRRFRTISFTSSRGFAPLHVLGQELTFGCFPPTISGADKAGPSQNFNIKTLNCVYTASTSEGTHRERKHPRHVLRDKGLSSRGILDYALACYLHAHTRTHTIQHPCQIPDDLNTLKKKKSPQKKISRVQIKSPTNYVQRCILALGSSSRPSHLAFPMDFPLRRPNF